LRVCVRGRADYRSVSKIGQLYGDLERVREGLRECITEDFSYLLDVVTPTSLSHDAIGGGPAGGIRVLSAAELG